MTFKAIIAYTIRHGEHTTEQYELQETLVAAKKRARGLLGMAGVVAVTVYEVAMVPVELDLREAA